MTAFPARVAVVGGGPAGLFAAERIRAQGHEVDLFDRMRFGAVVEGQLKLLAKDDFAAAVAEGIISNETLVVNTLVQNLQEMQQKWLVPFGKSWHRRLV